MKKLYFLFSWGIFLLSFISCKDNDTIDGKTGVNARSVNEWIESIMSENYYWYQDIPKSQNLNFSSEADEFFYSLLSQKDGKTNSSGHYYYSTIVNPSSYLRSSSANSLSFGFEYQAYHSTEQNKYALLVLYVLPDSPAQRNGLKRGSWIQTINGQPVDNNWSQQLESAITVNLGISESFYSATSKVATLNAESVLDNPIFLDTVYHYNNKKIAYLVYNHFTQGINQDETFNNQLRSVFSGFKSQSPQEFILDLRYNGGGLISCAQLLSTMLAPSSALGDIFCRINYSDKKVSKNYNLTFDEKYMKQNVSGENLNLSRLFIITSSRTASASEAVINGLRPFLGDNLIIVGETTEGKNVGSITYTDSRFEWELHPIVCKISNKDNFSDYESGFIPRSGFTYSEPSNLSYELGDTREYILNKVISFIFSNESITTTKSSSLIEDNLTKVGSSLDNKKTNGLKLPNE